MQENNYLKFDHLNELIKSLWFTENRRTSLNIALDTANEIMRIIGINKHDLPSNEEALDNAFEDTRFRNQKMELWFEKHPYFGGARVALDHYINKESPIESHFYWLNNGSSKAKISAATQITENWEDKEMHHHPQYKVGIDFFLNYKANSLSMVITNQGKLRIMEFSEKLSNTQIEILNNIKNCACYEDINLNNGNKSSDEPQRIIHQALWNALELKEVNKKFYIGIADAFELLCQHLRKNVPYGINNDKEYENNIKIFSSRLLGRLLFIWFLRKKNLINSSKGYFDVDEYDDTNYYENKLKVLFFKTLNTPTNQRENDDFETPYLNGGLFDAHENDWVDRIVPFPQNWFVSLYNHLNQFNFTTDESSPEYEQIAIDPEMLGRVFENLLATIVQETSNSASDRKNKGAFYTPRDIVSYMCKESLKSYFKECVNNEKDYEGIDNLIDMSDSAFLGFKSSSTLDLWGIRTDQVRQILINAINNLKILDPACGSGAFPIGLMQLILKTIERLSAVFDSSIEKLRLGKSGEKNDIYLTKLFIIQNILYGSDIEPMAVEISRLRAWLSLIIDDSKIIDPLPNLDFKFVCANSLVKLPKSEEIQTTIDNYLNYDEDYMKNFENIRSEYFNAHNKTEKDRLKEEFLKLQKITEGKENAKKELLLKSWNPFVINKPADFFDSATMFNVSKFDIIIGNPPYIHFEDIKELSKKLYSTLGYKSYEARGDIYTLFFEMGVKNLKKGGTLCFITSNKWMRAGYGESLRNYFVDNVTVDLLIDLGAGVFESATVDTNILLIKNKKTKLFMSRAITLTSEYRNSNMSDFVKQNAIEVEFKKNQPWVVLTKIEQGIKNKIEKYGIPLRLWPDIKINRGILTGCNDAFIIDENKRKEILANCKDEEERDRTDKLIRPILRGRDIKQGTYEWAGLYIINTHNGYYANAIYINKIEIDDYPSVKKYLDTFYKKIENRDDQGDTPYNLRSCAYMDDLNKPKIMYSEIVSKPQFYFDTTGQFIPEASAFYLYSQNMSYLVKYLNSNISSWIFKKYYAGGGLGNSGYRYKKAFFVNLPIPTSIETDFYKAFRLTDEEKKYIEKVAN